MMNVEEITEPIVLVMEEQPQPLQEIPPEGVTETPVVDVSMMEQQHQESDIPPSFQPKSNVILGSLVAVLAHLEESQSEEWMLATLLAYDPQQHLYTVEDVEVPEDTTNVNTPSPTRKQSAAGEKRQFQVSPDKLIQLCPDDQTALDGGEIRLRQPVLALFPGTTCFYPAVVVSTPSRRKRTRDYLLKFKGDDVPNRQCSPRFIIQQQATQATSPLPQA